MRVVARQLAIAKRACESLDAATRIDPNNGQVWYYLAELACLTRQSDKLATYLKRLKQVDSVLWEQYQAEVSDDP
jgi:cytochrome c-type biogenesis protein CcmH/NrfG